AIRRARAARAPGALRRVARARAREGAARAADRRGRRRVQPGGEDSRDRADARRGRGRARHDARRRRAGLQRDVANRGPGVRRAREAGARLRAHGCHRRLPVPRHRDRAARAGREPRMARPGARLGNGGLKRVAGGEAFACASKPVEEKAVSPKATSAAPSATAKAATDPPPAGGSGAAAPALRKAVIGDFGLDLSARNRNVKPGDDFYACANGAWYDSFAIPPDHSSYGAFDQLDELSKKRVREIIEQAAAARIAAGTPEQQIGDYYAAFM